jgi:hypothetical protein
MNIEISVDYGQVCVFDPNLEKPFNDWESIHNRQGFTWRDTSVSFAVFDQSAWDFDLIVGKFNVTLVHDFVRLIKVPFEIKQNHVEIGSVINSTVYSMPAGIYKLYFGIKKPTKRGFGGFLCFEPGAKPCGPEILVADDLLDPPEILCMTAKPA